MAWIDPKKVPKRTLLNGQQIPCIGMGTFGSDRFTAEQISAAVAGAIRCGYRLFDCASVYGNEDQIGQVFAQAFQEGVVKRVSCSSPPRCGTTCTGRATCCCLWPRL